MNDNDEVWKSDSFKTKGNPEKENDPAYRLIDALEMTPYVKERYLIFVREPYGSEQLLFGFNTLKGFNRNVRKVNQKDPYTLTELGSETAFYRLVDTVLKRTTNSNLYASDLVNAVREVWGKSRE